MPFVILLLTELSGVMVVGAWAKNCKELREQDEANLEDQIDSYIVSDDVSAVHTSLRLPHILQDSTAPDKCEIARIQDKGTSWRLLGLQKPTAEPLAAWTRPSTSIVVSEIFTASPASI